MAHDKIDGLKQVESSQAGLAMEAHQLSDELVAPVQVSLRIRHPTIDPGEISAAIGVSPEHCFKSGDPAQGRRGLHTQTYWLAIIAPGSWPEPVDPNFLETLAARYSGRGVNASAETFRKAVQSARLRSVEMMLYYGLQRLQARRAFLERLQSEGGDVSLLLSAERGSAADFTLSVGMSRELVKLGITLEFKFDS
jgi:hypothetical protein